MRLCPIAGLVVLALAALSACGDEGAATLNRVAPARLERHSAGPGDGGRPCRRQLGRFVDSLTLLRDRLLAGLTYESYVAEVRQLRSAYRDLPVERLALGCLLAVGAPGESALNAYIDAANTWGNCLADASCAPESIESKLQRGWELASARLAAAHDGLREAE